MASQIDFILGEQAINLIQNHHGWVSGDGRYVESPCGWRARLRQYSHAAPFHSLCRGLLRGSLQVCLIGLYLIFYKSFAARGQRAILLAMTAAFICHDMTNNLFFVPEVALAFWLGWALLDAVRKPGQE